MNYLSKQGKIAKGGKTPRGSKHRSESKKQKTIFFEAKHKALAKDISLVSVEEAKKSVQKVNRRFRKAEANNDREEQVLILRVTQLAANRARVMSKNQNLGKKTRETKRKVADIYEAATEKMQEKLKR